MNVFCTLLALVATGRRPGRPEDRGRRRLRPQRRHGPDLRRAATAEAERGGRAGHPERRLVLDLARAEGSHSWSRPLLDKGFTVIILRHGSAPKYTVPEAVADVRRAVPRRPYEGGRVGHRSGASRRDRRQRPAGI